VSPQRSYSSVAAGLHTSNRFDALQNETETQSTPQSPRQHQEEDKQNENGDDRDTSNLEQIELSFDSGHPLLNDRHALLTLLKATGDTALKENKAIEIQPLSPLKRRILFPPSASASVFAALHIQKITFRLTHTKQRVVIHGVPSDITDEALLKALMLQNGLHTPHWAALPSPDGNTIEAKIKSSSENDKKELKEKEVEQTVLDFKLEEYKKLYPPRISRTSKEDVFLDLPSLIAISALKTKRLKIDCLSLAVRKCYPEKYAKVCHNCHIHGHFKNTCPDKHKGPRCRTCAQYGHVARDCTAAAPKCSTCGEAHKTFSKDCKSRVMAVRKSRTAAPNSRSQQRVVRTQQVNQQPQAIPSQMTQQLQQMNSQITASIKELTNVMLNTKEDIAKQNKRMEAELQKQSKRMESELKKQNKKMESDLKEQGRRMQSELKEHSKDMEEKLKQTLEEMNAKMQHLQADLENMVRASRKRRVKRNTNKHQEDTAEEEDVLEVDTSPVRKKMAHASSFNTPPQGNQAYAYAQPNMNPQQLFQVMHAPSVVPMMNMNTNMPLPMATYQGTPNQQMQPNMVQNNQQMQQYVGQGYQNQ